MKKKYEKPVLIVEVMALDMLQMSCTHHGGLPTKLSGVNGVSCQCCGTGLYYSGSTG